MEVGHAIGSHQTPCAEMTQQDDDPATAHHAERGWIAPESIELEAELFPIESRCGHDIVDDEVRAMPQRPFIQRRFLLIRCGSAVTASAIAAQLVPAAEIH
jgi:hypothetical protein